MAKKTAVLANLSRLWRDPICILLQPHVIDCSYAFLAACCTPRRQEQGKIYLYSFHR